VLESWSFTAREEHKLRIFENGPEEEITEELRKQHNEARRNLYPSLNIIRTTKLED
jgi:ADP-heptose:LPS heptosyltransferase